MSLKKKIRGVFATTALLIAFVTIPALPRKAIVSLSRSLARLVRRFAGKLNRISMANLDLAYGTELSLDRKEEIMQNSYANFSLALLDFFWFSWFTDKRISKWFKFDDSAKHYFDNTPLIVVASHFGNWELLALSYCASGETATSVAAPVKNKFAERLLTRQRKKTGQGIAKRKGALKAMLGCLRRGERIGLLLDQNTLPDEGGVFVNFFGLPVPVSNIGHVLSVKTGVPLVYTYCVPAEDGTYMGYTTPPFTLSDLDENTPNAITQHLTHLLEESVRKYPDKWLWSYKRWKFILEGQSPDSYPFYARKVERKSK